MRATDDFNSRICWSSAGSPSDRISFVRAKSERLRAPLDAVCKAWYSSCVRRKIRTLFRGLVTATWF